MTATALASPEVVLTDRAAKRVSRILSKEPEGTVLRISVAGGGCSGFQYEYNLVQEKPASDDIVLSKGDAVVLIAFDETKKIIPEFVKAGIGQKKN